MVMHCTVGNLYVLQHALKQSLDTDALLLMVEKSFRKIIINMLSSENTLPIANVESSCTSGTVTYITA